MRYIMRQPVLDNIELGADIELDGFVEDLFSLLISECGYLSNAGDVTGYVADSEYMGWGPDYDCECMRDGCESCAIKAHWRDKAMTVAIDIAEKSVDLNDHIELGEQCDVSLVLPNAILVETFK